MEILKFKYEDLDQISKCADGLANRHYSVSESLFYDRSLEAHKLLIDKFDGAHRIGIDLEGEGDKDIIKGEMAAHLRTKCYYLVTPLATHLRTTPDTIARELLENGGMIERMRVSRYIGKHKLDVYLLDSQLSSLGECVADYKEAMESGIQVRFSWQPHVFLKLGNLCGENSCYSPGAESASAPGLLAYMQNTFVGMIRRGDSCMARCWGSVAKDWNSAVLTNNYSKNGRNYNGIFKSALEKIFGFNAYDDIDLSGDVDNEEIYVNGDSRIYFKGSFPNRYPIYNSIKYPNDIPSAMVSCYECGDVYSLAEMERYDGEDYCSYCYDNVMAEVNEEEEEAVW